MGIENRPLRIRVDREPVSLPLMGIENSVIQGRDTMSRLCLITPHGDRKLGGGGERGVVVPLLITPHGDRKHSTRRLVLDLVDSLPLMGIENAVPCVITSSRFSRPSLPLMGIENDGSQACTWSRTRTHYPSWGSKTPAGEQAIEDAVDASLPLMGIENSRRNSRPSHPNGFSLPLMGIENLPGTWCRPWGSRPHYPSWGSKTPFRMIDRVASGSVCTHYPSWGSKTGADFFERSGTG